MPGYRRVAARDELRSKTMDLAAPAAELSAPDPRLVMKKRLSDEMDALRGILKKAELVVRKPADKGREAPRRGKDGHFLAGEARSEKDGRFLAAEAPCAKRRKAMPAVEIIEPPPRISKADLIPCAKKRTTTPPMEIIEPRISKDEMFSLVTRLSSLSSNMPARIVEFLNKECTGHADQKAGEIEIDLGSMRRSAMLELQKLLDEFAEAEEKRRQQKEESMKVCRSISCSSPRELEEGEFIKEGDFIEDCGATAETCVGDASPVVATPETAKGPSNSSSSGSSCSDSSNSDSDDSDSDHECLTSNVAPAVLPTPKADASAIAMAAKDLCSPLLQDGKMTEEEVIDICGDASPIAAEKFVESAKSPISINSSSSSSSGSSSSGSSSSGSSCSDSSDPDSSDSDSDDECVTSNPAPVVLPNTNASPMARPHKILSPIAETRNSPRSNNNSLLADGEKEKEQESRGAYPMAAKKFAEIVNSGGSTNGQCVRSGPAPAVRPEQSKPQPAAQGTVRHFCAMGFAKKRELERKRAYEKLEEMERNARAKPIFDWIHPNHLRQLGITTAVEYAVSSERRFPSGRGCPVQSVLGLFLKAEQQITGMVRWRRSH